MVIGEILTWVAVACSGMLAFTVFWRRPPQPLWPSLFFVYCSALFWAFGELGSSFLARTESAYSLWLILNYTGILFLMPTWWLFSLAFAELQGRPIPWANRVVRYGPFGLAAVYWIAMISNPLHYQFHIPQIAGHNDYRIVWYIQTATNYALFLAVTCVFLWLRWRLRRSFLREQMNIMVAATAIPLICNVLFVSRVFDPGFDITVGAFTASTVLFYIGIYRTRLFILSPITLQHVIDNERNGVILVDGDFRLLQANPATTQFMDSSEIFPEVELLPLLARRLSSHENGDDPIDSESLRRALADPNQPLEGNIYCYDHPTCHWLQIDSTTLPDRRGNRLGFALRLHDITGAVQAKEALVRSEQRFRSLVKSAPVCIHEISREGRVVSMNDAGLRMMGVQREDEVCGLDYLKIPVTEDRERVANLLKRALEGESSIFEFATASETGPVYFLASFAPIKDEREKVVKLMGVSQDISNQKRAQARELELEQQLLQSQKVESLGTLAGGIAHDFNNILQSILGYTSIALENPDGNTPLLEEYLKEIERGGLRAKDLVDQILTFSRKRNVERQSLNLPPLVEEYIRFIRSTLPATIRIDSDIDFDCAQVSADTTQIGRAHV